MTNAPQQPIGDMLGKYKILGTLGRGSMGVVYKAEDPEIGRMVAIKTLRKLGQMNDVETQKAIQRFRTEARSAGRLRHPNIITVFDASIEGDVPYIVMDYVTGDGLDVFIARERRLEPKRAIPILRQIAEALDEAHRQGVIHRDIKPSNIIIDRQERVYVLDFGVAKLNDSIQPGTTSSPAAVEGQVAEAVVGTPAYMSPEQILNRPLDHRSDLFSLALVAYELLAGVRPFVGDSFKEVVNNILHASPVPISSIVKDIPLQLEVEFEHALSKKPTDRFSSAIETIRVFETALFGKGGYAAAIGRGIDSAGTVGRTRKASDWQSIGVNPATAIKSENQAAGMSRPSMSEPSISDNAAAVDDSAIRSGNDSSVVQEEEEQVTPAVSPSQSYRSHNSPFGNEYFSPGDAFSHSTDSLNQQVEFKKRLSIVRLLILIFGVTAIVASIVLLVSFALQKVPLKIFGATEKDGIATEREIAFSNPIRPKAGKIEVDPKQITGSPTELSDEHLYALLTNEDTEVQKIVEGLRSAKDRKIPGLITAVLALLNHDSYIVRIESLKVIGSSRDRTLAPQILKTLEDHDPLVRSASARAIAELGSQQSLAYLKVRYQAEERNIVKEEIKKAIEKISGLPFQ